jgi:hypothetical protein
MQWKPLLVGFVVFALGCSSPPPKDGSNNGSGNNENDATNSNSTNGTPNGATNSTSGGPFIDPEDYDQACEWDSECVLVYGGDVCGCGMVCPGAIAASAQEQFDADVEGADCSNIDSVGCPAIACEPMMAVCSSGDCTAVPQVEVDPSQFDQSCTEDQDCMIITSGPICSDCNCSRAGINVSEEEDYEELVGDIDCRPGPQTCDCAPPTEAHCNDDGMCEAGFGQ